MTRRIRLARLLIPGLALLLPTAPGAPLAGPADAGEGAAGAPAEASGPGAVAEAGAASGGNHAAPWRAARWGMDAAALRAAVPGLEAASLDYGALVGAFVLRETRIAGLGFRAIFQTGPEGRLRQILFERRRPELRPGDLLRAYDGLSAARGPADRLCHGEPRGGGPARAEAVWPGAAGPEAEDVVKENGAKESGAKESGTRNGGPEGGRLGAGVLHLSWVDFGAGEALGDLEAAERRRLLRQGEVRAAREVERAAPPPGALVGALPRRLLIRWREPGRPELAGDCAPIPAPRPSARGARADGEAGGGAGRDAALEAPAD